ncbi:MAG: glycine zipper 2TM domain-containing protein [Gammaproteobacteria bacterium]
MKNTKNVFVAAATILMLGFSSTILAGHADRDNRGDRHYSDRHYQDRHHHNRRHHDAYARVVHVKPIYKRVRVAVPEQHCRHREVRKPVVRHIHRHDGGDIVAGGIIGGIIGHELGRGRDQGLATVTGALIGSAIAHEANSQYYTTGEYRVEHNRHCRTEMRYHTERRLIGYRVKYRYRGDIYVTRMDYHPGKRIRIDRHGDRHGHSGGKHRKRF